MQNDRSRGGEDDINSYSYLAQGSSSSLAGSKRGHDAVATASFFEDVRRKKVAPTYDMAMAERIENTFANGIDDASLQSLLSSFASDSANDSSGANSPATSHHSHQSPGHIYSTSNKLSLPEAFKQTDLADLNAFLLQVGVNAARTESISSNTADPGIFDFANALNACGLTGVPGYDDGFVQWPMENDVRHNSSHPAAGAEGQWAANGGGMYGQRPIAHLPHRNSSFGYTAQHQQQQYYQQPQHHYQQHQPYQQMHPHAMYGHGGVPSTSFDSVRASRGPAYVPQLGPKEMNGQLYRHVEALTRAEPLPRPTIDTSRRESMDEEMKDVSPTVGRAASTSPSLGIYPRVNSNDSLRKLPSPIAKERGSGSNSIASILDSCSDPRPRRRTDDFSLTSSSPASPPSTSGLSSPSPLYPRLGDSMDGIEEDVAAMDVKSSGSIPAQVRKSHTNIILDLLMAINFPGRRDVRLAPIKLPLSRSEDVDSRREDEGSDESITPRTTPKLDTARKLPDIASLLNAVDARSELRGAGGRRIMDIDV
jgi:hypothetical protein